MSQKIKSKQVKPLLFKKIKFSNGPVLVYEHRPSQAVSIGIYIPKGTRHEPKKLGGIAHFTEHLAFKGTNKRSALQIVQDIERLGGEINAATGREYTEFHTLTLKEDWKVALDVLFGLVFEMKISESDFKIEKGVVLEEILMSEDDVEDLAHDNFLMYTLGKHPLSQPIQGTVQSLDRIQFSDVLRFYETQYKSPKMVIAIAGDIPFLKLQIEVQNYLKKFPIPQKRNILEISKDPAKVRRARVFFDKPTDQVHIFVGIPIGSVYASDRYEALILSALLGGGMSSRLFQGLRERLGLVYTIQSSLETFCDCGFIYIQLALNPKNIGAALREIENEISKLNKEGVLEDEMTFSKKQVCGSLLLSAEDVDARMQSIGVNEMLYGKYRSLKTIRSSVEKVNESSLNNFIKKYIHPKNVSLSAVGDWKKLKLIDRKYFKKIN